MNSQNEILQLSGLFKVLGDETRLRILLLLQKNELWVGELQQILEVGQSALSSQLAGLRDNNLVSNRKEGQKVYYKFGPLDQNDISHSIIENALKQARNSPLVERDQEKLKRVLHQRSQNSTQFFNSLKGKELRAPGQTFESMSLGFFQVLPYKQVVDLGCGSGNLARLLATTGKDVIGIDSSEEQLKKARELEEKFSEESESDRGSLKFVNGLMEQTGLEEESCDLVVLSQALHHVAEPSGVLAEAHRILRKGGKLLILDLSSHQQDWLREKFGDFWLGFDPRDLKNWLRENHFKDIKSLCHSDGETEGGIETLILSAEK